MAATHNQQCSTCTRRTRDKSEAPQCKWCKRAANPGCRHCGRIPAARPRGLCCSCYGDMKIRTQYECQEQYAAKGEPTDEELDATLEEQSSGFVSRICHRCGGSLLVSAGLAQIGSRWECERPCVRVLIDDLVECEG